MKKIMYYTVTVIFFLAVIAAFAAPTAVAQDTGQPLNVLLMVTESGRPLVPLIFSLDFSAKTVKVVSFYYQTQIDAVTRNGEMMSMPMDFLAYCDRDEMIKAYENTFGINIDRYVIFDLAYGDFSPAIAGLDALCPLTLDVPEEVLGEAEGTTVNGNMKGIAQTLGRAYTQVTQAGMQALDAVGVLGYFTATPERIWDTDDRYTLMMNDYQYWDAKNVAMIEALKPLIARMDTDTVRLIWNVMTDGKDTNITQEDIDAWSQIAFRFPEDSQAYLTVPGFEGISVQKFEKAGSLTGIGVYQAYMLTYDNDAAAIAANTFLYGD